MKSVIELDRVFPCDRDYRYQVVWLQSVINQRRRYIHRVVDENKSKSKSRYLDNNGDEVCYVNDSGFIEYQPFILIAGSKNKIEYAFSTLTHCQSGDLRNIEAALEYTERDASLSLHIDYKKNGNFDATDKFVAEINEFKNGQWVKK